MNEPLKVTQYHDTLWTVVLLTEITLFAFPFCEKSKAEAFCENIKEHPNIFPEVKAIHLKSGILH